MILCQTFQYAGSLVLPRFVEVFLQVYNSLYTLFVWIIFADTNSFHSILMLLILNVFAAVLRGIVFTFWRARDRERTSFNKSSIPTPEMDVDKESVRQVIQRLEIISLHEQLDKQHEFFKKKKSAENKRRFKDRLRDAKNACVIAD